MKGFLCTAVSSFAILGPECVGWMNASHTYAIVQCMQLEGNAA